MKKIVLGVLFLAAAGLCFAASQFKPASDVQVETDTLGRAVRPIAASSYSWSTMTAGTSWSHTSLTASTYGQLLFWNSGPGTMYWFIDRATAVPAFAGISFTAASDPKVIDYKGGDILHWRFSDSATTGLARQAQY